MGNLQEYKCPCCGGAIEFNSKLQKMKCPYCDTEFEIETLQGYEKELQNEQSDDMTWETSAGSEWQKGLESTSANPVAEKLLPMQILPQHPAHTVIIRL